MSSIRLTVQTVTPLLMFGANNDMKRGDPELRASSIRGILRYWLRAVLGSKGLNPTQLYKEESEILGNTEQGSRVNLRVMKGRSTRVDNRLSVLPERTSRGFTLQQPGFEAESGFRITLSTHPLDKSEVLADDSPLVKAIFLMCHFGGLGRRARRGSGNLAIFGAKGYRNEQLPLAFIAENRDELADYLGTVSRFISPPATTIGMKPSYPVFAWDTAVVLVGNRARSSYQEAYSDLWSASGPYHDEGGIFGDVRPRRSSAMHMRVNMVGTEDDPAYVPVQTILYTGNGRWNKMQDYIQHQLSNGFSDVYGTWGHWT